MPGPAPRPTTRSRRPTAAWDVAVVLCLVALACGPRTVAEDLPAVTGPGTGEVLRFHRVQVPRGRLADIPLGNGRLVPIPRSEFEDAVAALGDRREHAAPQPPAQPVAESWYEARWTPDGQLEGTLSFDIKPEVAPVEVPLLGLAVQGATVSVEGGDGLVSLYGRNGDTILMAARAGRYTCRWTQSPGTGQSAGGFVIPLMSAGRGSLVLELPRGFAPLVVGSPWARQARPVAAVNPGTSSVAAWRIDFGPLQQLLVSVVPERDPGLRLQSWQRVDIARGQIHLATTLVPQTPWRAARLQLDADPRLILESATFPARFSAAGAPSGAEAVAHDALWEITAGGMVEVVLPEALLGTTAPLTIHGVAHVAFGDPDWLPTLRLQPSAWAGGGLRVACEPGLVVVDVDLEDCQAVPAAAADSWPLSPPERATADTTLGALFAVEEQGPAARVWLAVEVRVAELDVARVTTVDVSAAGVLGRAVCDVQVRRGATFEIVGRVTPGWFIDGVEEVSGRLGSVDGRAAQPATAGESVEWRVVRDRGSDMLRIGLPSAASPGRSVALRISGHREGVSTDVPFACADMDMVRLEGEEAGAAVLAMKSQPETTIELPAAAAVPAEIPPRLAALLDPTAIRAWLPVDGPVAAGTARLLRRRPPLEADASIRLTARDDRLSQSFTFVCRPEASPLDAVVVHFSEPMDDLLEWSLLPPANASLAVRRMEAGGERSPAESSGESWLIEFQPPLRDQVSIRASRVVPFQGPVPVPLAWVQGSQRHNGDVVVVNAGRRRPLIINRRLEELPPANDGGLAETPQGILAEFAFTPATGSLPAVAPAAELLPGSRDRDEDARAWVWSEETSCWCHATGVAEYETRFDIENHGRTSVAIAAPMAVISQGVLLDGARAAVELDAKTGALQVDLPADRRFVRLVVRSVAEGTTGPGMWRIGVAGAAIDVPVLERTWRVLLPDGVEIASIPDSLRRVGEDEPGWLERLLPMTVRPRVAQALPPSPPRQPTAGAIEAGFREAWFVASSGRGPQEGLLLVRGGWLRAAALLVGLMAAGTTLFIRRRVGRLLVVVLMAIAALWLPVPLDGLARAGLWGTVALLAIRWAIGRRVVMALVVALLIVWPVSCGSAAEPGMAGSDSESIPVFIVPGPDGADTAAPSLQEGDADVAGLGATDGETALVPERLFRVLSAAAGRRAESGVRLLAARVTARPGSTAPWQLVVDVDSDAGGLLALAQDGRSAAWGNRWPRLDGIEVQPAVGSDTRRLLMAFPSAGRHRIEADLAVTPSRDGEIESVVALIPSVPRAELAVEGALAASAGTVVPYQCEAAAVGAVFSRAPLKATDAAAAGGLFDISRATAVRLSWAGDGRTRLADVMPMVESRNDLTWRDGACRLQATFDVDPGDAIIRGIEIRSDPRLVPDTSISSNVSWGGLGGGRYRIELPEPRRGKRRIEVAMVMPLVDPVGVFDLPEAWLEGATSDIRTAQIAPAADLIMKITPPDDALPVAVRGAEGLVGVQAWRFEAAASTRATEPALSAVDAPTTVLPVPRTGPPRATIERRRQPLRGSQRLDVVLGDEQLRMRLAAQIDAAVPLVTLAVEVPAAAEIERVVLRGNTEGEEKTAEALDVRWHRAAPGRVDVVVQQPRQGQFELELQARIPGPLAPVGSVPLMRALFDAPGQQTVSWKTTPGRVASVWPAITDAAAVASSLDDGADRTRATASGSLDVASDSAPPGYRIEDAAPDGTGDEPLPEAETGNHLESGSAAGAALLSTTEASPVGPRVELAETHLAFDSRGRVWGVSRFDVVAAETLIRLQLPAGMRMFDVFVDGRVANDAVPARSNVADNAWEVRLLDIGWPRSILAVYAGEFAETDTRNGILEIQPPTVFGLPCLRTAWVLEMPVGQVLKVAPPTRVVDAGVIAGERLAALDRLAPEFARAVARASPDEARRLEDFVEKRRREAVLTLPASWSHAEPRDRIGATAFAPPVHLLEGGDPRPLRLTVIGGLDRSLPGRGLVTVILLLAAAALLELRRRWPAAAGLVARLAAAWWTAPLAAFIIGSGWIVSLVPSWPGWLLVVWGAATLCVRQSPGWWGWWARRLRSGGDPPVERRAGAGSVTRWLPTAEAKPGDEEVWLSPTSRLPRPPESSGSTARPGR